MVNPVLQELLPELWEVLGDHCYWPQAAEGDTRGLQSTFGLGSWKQSVACVAIVIWRSCAPATSACVHDVCSLNSRNESDGTTTNDSANRTRKNNDKTKNTEAVNEHNTCHLQKSNFFPMLWRAVRVKRFQ